MGNDEIDFFRLVAFPMSSFKFSPDQITTVLGIVGAINLYLAARGRFDLHTSEFVSAVLVLAAGYFTNKR